MKSMKSFNPRFWLRPALVCVLMAGLTGCHGPGYRKSDTASWNSQAASMEVKNEIRHLDLAVAALNELVNQPETDARPQFLRFGATVDQLSLSKKQVEASIGRLWRKRVAYFKVWDREILALQDEEVRHQSQLRREEVSDQFEAVLRRAYEVQEAMRPVINYLRDIRRALSTDLTRDGLASMKPLVTHANESAHLAQKGLMQLAADLDVLSARTASYRVLDVKP